MITCTRCDGSGILNRHQLPDDIASYDCHEIIEWLKTWDEPNDVTVCDCCGNGEYWYGEPGHHYSSNDPLGRHGPYSYNGGLAECH